MKLLKGFQSILVNYILLLNSTISSRLSRVCLDFFFFGLLSPVCFWVVPAELSSLSTHHAMCWPSSFTAAKRCNFCEWENSTRLSCDDFICEFNFLACCMLSFVCPFLSSNISPFITCDLNIHRLSTLGDYSQCLHCALSLVEQSLARFRLDSELANI